MKHIFVSSISLLFLLFLLLLEACADSETLSLPMPDEGEGSGVYVSISVAVADSQGTQSRAIGSPKPGENGDSLQVGMGDENKVYDLNVFFFQGEVDENTGERLGINSPHADEIDIIHIAYFSDLIPEASGNITRYITPAREIDDLQIGQTYDVLVVANLGRDAEQLSGLDKNLASLRDYRVLAMSGDKEDGYHFRMASAGPEVNSIKIIPNNSPTKPSIVSVYVERLAARVDCCWNDSYEVTGEELPSEEGSSSTEADKVKILGASLVNRYRGETWAFKRVTNGLTDLNDITYLGDETVNNSGVASNYVLDPLTLTVSGKSNSDYNYYYTEYVNWNVDTDFQNPFTIQVTSEHGGDTYIRWAYTRENVNQADVLSDMNGRELYATGIMFQAQYTPAGFREGDTFYVYPNNGVRTIYTADGLRMEHGDVFADLPEANWGDVDGCEVYDQGRCYYVYWIRHADDYNTADISPMEYAIVRNNIYQLKINSISGLGTPEPDSNVEEVEFDIHVWVKPWAKVEVEVPPFD